MAILSGFLLVLLIISAILLVIIVLMQDEQGEGLGGIFGGGATQQVGNRSGNILTRATAVIATIFLITVFGYAWINRTPEASGVVREGRALDGEEAFLEWWSVDEPVELPEGTTVPTLDSTPAIDPTEESAPEQPITEDSDQEESGSQ